MTRGLKAWSLGRREESTCHGKSLAGCTTDELWRGELDLELAELARRWSPRTHKSPDCVIA